MKQYEFAQRVALPYKAKLALAENRIREFAEKITATGNTYVAVGGLDSIVLLCFIRSLNIDAPGVSVSSLEDKSIQAIHKSLGVITVSPLKTKVQVIKEFGFPVLSKDSAKKIAALQCPTVKNARQRQAAVTGKRGDKECRRIGLPKKWLKLFGGLENPEFAIAPFKVSNKCCYYLKEKPMRLWEKENNSSPYLGLMAAEGGQRELALIKHGCNFYGKTISRSCPFSFFTKSDVIRLALKLDVPIPSIYGEVTLLADNNLTMSGATRTGCSMCGFGIQLEKRPHRFDILKVKNLKEWEFWMYEIGWGEVLTYIGVDWEDE